MKHILTCLLLSPLVIWQPLFSAQPNVLLILADDLGYGDVRCYNDQLKGEIPRPHQLRRQSPRDAPGQLYNLETDPGETQNLHFERPEIEKELKALLEQTKAAGHSAP